MPNFHKAWIIAIVVTNIIAFMLISIFDWGSNVVMSISVNMFFILFAILYLTLKEIDHRRFEETVKINKYWEDYMKTVDVAAMKAVVTYFKMCNFIIHDYSYKSNLGYDLTIAKRGENNETKVVCVKSVIDRSDVFSLTLNELEKSTQMGDDYILCLARISHEGAFVRMWSNPSFEISNQSQALDNEHPILVNGVHGRPVVGVVVKKKDIHDYHWK